MAATNLNFAEHQSWIFDLTKLQLHFLWNWLKNHPDEKFADGLRDRVDLVRKTDPNPKHADIAEFNADSPQWQEIVKMLTPIYEDSKDDENADLWEFTAFEHIKPILAEFAEKTFGSTKKLEEYQCGSLKYDPPKENEPKAVDFHIGNVVAPKSIFTDPGYLENCFLDLMDQTEEKYGADTLKTGTWLNSVPKWLEYFPEEWKENMEPEWKDPQWHFGYWGQFISAKGTFNEKYANILRETGEFPFYPRSSRCSFAAMRKHLNQKLNNA